MFYGFKKTPTHFQGGGLPVSLYMHKYIKIGMGLSKFQWGVTLIVS